MDPNPKIKKRKYSRAGCLVCKQRKIKCDEAKPQCLNCERGSRQCSYEPRAKARADGMLISTDSMLITASVSGDSTNAGTNASTDLAADAWLLAHELHDILGHNGLDMTEELLPPLALAMDLMAGQAVGQAVGQAEEQAAGEQARPEGESNGESDGEQSGEMGLSHHQILKQNHHDRGPIPTTTILPTHVALFLEAHDDLPKNYLRLFYLKYGLWLMPLAPDGPNVFTTTVLATAIAVPFLKHAIMAITASFEYSISRSTTDQYYYHHYTKLSLQGLTTAFSNSHAWKDQIVALIFTSLLFVTDGAKDGTWRAHLRGASQLFRRYLSGIGGGDGGDGGGIGGGDGDGDGGISGATVGGVLVAASWFFSFEIIAVATSPGGGSISTASHMDDVLLPLKQHHALAVQMGLCLPDGYNIFLGLSSKTISLFVYFVKLSVSYRASGNTTGTTTTGTSPGPKPGPVSVDQLLPLMALFHEAIDQPVVSKTGIIGPSSPYYPRPHGQRFVPDECYGYDGGRDIVYSWYDISDKVHAYGLLLRVLTDKKYWGLDSTSPVVQDVVRKMLKWCYFMPDKGSDREKEYRENREKDRENGRENGGGNGGNGGGNGGGTTTIDRRMLMIHLSMMVCGSRCVRKEDTARVGEYFRQLKEMGVRTVRLLAEVAEGEAEQGDFVPYL